MIDVIYPSSLCLLVTIYYEIDLFHIKDYILKRKSFATVLHPFFLQYGPCEDILMIIACVPAQ